MQILGRFERPTEPKSQMSWILNQLNQRVVNKKLFIAEARCLVNI